MHFVKSSGNKLLSILKQISSTETTINQADSPLLDPKNINTSGNGREKTITVNFAIRNERMGESKGDAKVGSEV